MEGRSRIWSNLFQNLIKTNMALTPPRFQPFHSIAADRPRSEAMTQCIFRRGFEESKNHSLELQGI
jgi:hypothetical protein